MQYGGMLKYRERRSLIAAPPHLLVGAAVGIKRLSERVDVLGLE